jgi:putative ATP-dependent endonuclease of the OLD family
LRITSIRVQNFRSIEDLNLSFPSYYTAVCGKNDAGKSNIIRVLRSVFRGPERGYWPAEPSISVKDDYTKWKEREKDASPKFIQIDVDVNILSDDDEGLFRFLKSYLQIPDSSTSVETGIALRLVLRTNSDSVTPSVGVFIDNQPVESLKAQDVFKNIQSSFAVLFHDSTEFFHSYRFLESTGLFREMPPAEEKQLAEAKIKLDKVLNKIARRNQQDLTGVLGRLKDKYKLGLNIASIDTDATEVPYNITLGNDDLEVELERWGSGTQNRTRILMTMFKAKKVRDSAASANKVTPIIVIEEPESYLHPSAQAEFGAILRDLAEEFKVQVIVTTHSPYLLSLDEPKANILLERKVYRGKLRSTDRIDTSGDRWMEPFSLALGISGSELDPWKDALFSGKSSVLLVEGAIDKAYIELLQKDENGSERLVFDGIIFDYGGKDTLKQKQLLRFIKSNFKKFIVTFDLDAQSDVEHHLQELGMKKNIDYISIGRDSPGKKCIEGLLPDSVCGTVYAANVDLVQKLSSGVQGEVKSAKSALKRLLLDEFCRTVPPNAEGYKNFYQLSRQLNKMIA